MKYCTFVFLVKTLVQLFILCTNALSCMLHFAGHTNWIHGIRFGHAGLSISHLLSADDSLIFAQADEKEFAQLKSILDKYSCSLRAGDLFWEIFCFNLSKIEMRRKPMSAWSKAHLIWLLCTAFCVRPPLSQHRVLYTSRSCNSVSHCIAKMALSILKPLLWLEEVSKEIEALQSYTCDEY